MWCFLRGFVPGPSVHRQDVNGCVNATASALGTSETDKAESQSSDETRHFDVYGPFLPHLNYNYFYTFLVLKKSSS